MWNLVPSLVDSGHSPVNHFSLSDNAELIELSMDVDVLTAQEDGSRELSDAKLLDRAVGLRRLLFTQDIDF